MNSYLWFLSLAVGQLAFSHVAIGGMESGLSPKEVASVSSVVEGPQSPYTEWMLTLLAQWPASGRRFPGEGERPVWLRCLETPDHPNYVGVEQTLRVNAPFEAVLSVLEDINHYAEIFPSYKDIRILENTGTKLLTYWEQIIPFFLLPNVKYEMWYLVAKSHPGRAIFRYQLKSSNSLKSSDGVIVIEKNGERTDYTEYDFFDAKWGLLALSPQRIWRESVEGIFLSDMGIKLKAEDPKKSGKDIQQSAKSVLKEFPLDDVLKLRFPAQKLIMVPM